MSEKRDEFISELRKDIDYSQVVFGYKNGILNPNYEKAAHENLPDKANVFLAKKVEAEYQRRKQAEGR